MFVTALVLHISLQGSYINVGSYYLVLYRLLLHPEVLLPHLRTCCLCFIQERQKVLAEMEVSGMKRHDLVRVRLYHMCKAVNVVCWSDGHCVHVLY